MEDFQTVNLHQDNDPLCPENCCPKPSNASGCNYQSKAMKNKEVHCYSAVCRKGDPKKVKRSRKSVQINQVCNEVFDVNSNQPTDSNSNQVK